MHARTTHTLHYTKHTLTPHLEMHGTYPEVGVERRYEQHIHGTLQTNQALFLLWFFYVVTVENWSALKMSAMQPGPAPRAVKREHAQFYTDVCFTTPLNGIDRWRPLRPSFHNSLWSCLCHFLRWNTHTTKMLAFNRSVAEFLKKIL